MLKIDLYEAIKHIQEGNRTYIGVITSTLDPLIRKYSRKLGYEDAYNDLVLFIIELVHKIDLRKFSRKGKEHDILSYISKSVSHKYISLSKQKDLDARMYTDNDNEFLNFASSYDGYDDVIFFSIISSLTSLQQKVLTYIYYFNYSVSETAQVLKISRQAVNQSKKRAISKLYNDLGNIGDIYESK